jgi:hypothetical protein
MLPVEPAAAGDDFVLHHADVDGGPAEGGEAKLREDGGDLAQARWWL